MSDLQDRATAGEELPVDSATIEQTLAELWRVEKSGDDDHAVTRAALWNVVAHASTAEHHSEATQTLSKAAASIPQRTITVRADPAAKVELSSWISANCRMVGEGKQVCSEEIAIVAGGDRVIRVPPLVNALLIPDMPVAVWWLGDLPHEDHDYVRAMLRPADRLIVDSVWFDNAADLDIVAAVSARTSTAPADLNWVRGDEWRVATASVFDPPAMREKIRTLRSIRVIADTTERGRFGQWVESLYLSAWLIAQAGCDPESVETSFELRDSDRHGIVRVELDAEGSAARVERDPERCVITTNVDGHIDVPEGVTRSASRPTDELIVRELKQPASDAVFRKVLPLAVALARRIPR